MKYSTAIVGALAAVANANMYPGHKHFPRANATVASSADPITTLTVTATKLHTITSCLPTVTNCPVGKNMTKIPESDRVVKTVTDTVILATTVCPVSDVAKITSSLHSQHSNGEITGSTVKPTGLPSGYTTKVVPQTNVKTLTMTLGPEGSQTVKQSVVTSVVEATITVPCDKEEPTTTTTATRTSTRTITVAPNPTRGPEVSGQSCNAATTVTETVTAPASTVYVTVPCDSGKATQAPAQQPQPSQVGEKAVSQDTGARGSQQPPAAASSSTSCAPDSTITIDKVVTVVPYPKTNSTGPASGAAKPTGTALRY